MSSGFVDQLFESLKKKAFWPRIEPFVIVVLGLITAEIATYQYLGWRYGYSPDPIVFAKSYVSIWIGLICAGLMLLVAVFRITRSRPRKALDTPSGVRTRKHPRGILY